MAAFIFGYDSEVNVILKAKGTTFLLAPTFRQPQIKPGKKINLIAAVFLQLFRVGFFFYQLLGTHSIPLWVHLFISPAGTKAYSNILRLWVL